MARRLVLLGSGHAHLLALRAFARERPRDLELVLVTPDERQLYSGMLPGFLQGTYALDELSIPLGQLCERAGARLVLARAEAIDAPAKRIVLPDESLAFDLLSVNVGAAPEGLDVPGAREHACRLRPWSGAVAVRERLERLGRERTGSARVVIVGAGAAGVELALAASRHVDAVTLVERGDDVLPELPRAARRRIRRLLGARGISLRLGAPVSAVEPGAIVLADGILPSALTLWSTGAAPPPLLARSRGLPLDDRGFLAVDETLRATNGASVWAAGDCATLRDQPELPRAGVVAVRQAPVLTHNLRAELAGGRPRPFRPRRHHIALLNTADGRALLRYGGIVAHGRSFWWLKDRIDRRFIRSFR